jgi:putative ABC transport system permease protein
VAALAFGMGLNILIFSFTSPVLLKALPYPEPDRLVDVSMAPATDPASPSALNPAAYVFLRDKTSAVLDAVGVFDAGRSANLAGDGSGPAQRLNGHRISATGLAALGARPVLGRLPAAADEQASAAPTMVLSYDLWQRRFAGSADVVGRTVNVDGQPTVILGVMPEGFGLLDNSSDAWFTFGFEPALPPGPQRVLRGVGRLKPGVSIAQAQTEVNDEYARIDQEWTIELTPWREARFGAMRRPLWIVQLAVGGMLLVLCVNIAVLSRKDSRSLFTLALGGGVIGGVMAAVAIPALREMTPRVLPRLDEVAFDVNVLAFTFVICVAAGLVMWMVARPHLALPHSALRTSALTTFVALQITLVFVLLAAAGLATRAFVELRSRNVGIDPSGLLSADVHLPRDPYVTLNAAQAGSIELAEYNPAGAALYDRIRAALQAMPGVVQAAGVGTQPFASAPFVQFWIEPQDHAPENQIAAQYLAVTENYFNTLGIRIVRGRDFLPADRADSPRVVLVNESMVRQHFPDANPIGQRLTLTFHPNDEEPPREIVGVVADTLPFRGASEVRPLIFLLHRQQAAQQRASFEGRRTVMSFVVRTSDDPLALGDAIRAAVNTVDVTTPVAAIRTVESYLDAGQVNLLKFAAALIGVFALVALVTSAVGIYGLTLYGTVAAVVIGAALGFVAWRRLASIIEPFLTNLTVTPSDPLPLVITGGVIVVIALILVRLKPDTTTQ